MAENKLGLAVLYVIASIFCLVILILCLTNSYRVGTGEYECYSMCYNKTSDYYPCHCTEITRTEYKNKFIEDWGLFLVITVGLYVFFIHERLDVFIKKILTRKKVGE